MKKLLSVTLLIFCCCMLFVGCTAKENAEKTTTTNGSDTSSPTESTTSQQMPQKHIVSLTMNNYSIYIETSLVVHLTPTPQKVVFTANGCLSYAYYENVVFEVEHDGEKMLVACNAAGNGNGSYGGRNLGTITAVSGTIIYWM